MAAGLLPSAFHYRLWFLFHQYFARIFFAVYHIRWTWPKRYRFYLSCIDCNHLHHTITHCGAMGEQVRFIYQRNTGRQLIGSTGIQPYRPPLDFTAFAVPVETGHPHSVTVFQTQHRHQVLHFGKFLYCPAPPFAWVVNRRDFSRCSRFKFSSSLYKQSYSKSLISGSFCT